MLVPIVVFLLALGSTFQVRVLNKDIKSEKKDRTKVIRTKAKGKTGTKVRKSALNEVRKEISILNERLFRLEEFYSRGEIEEEVYRILKEEYENKKKELEKKIKSNKQKKLRKKD